MKDETQKSPSNLDIFIKLIEDRLASYETGEEETFRATVVKYVDDEAIATATGTFAQVIKELNITGIEDGTYFKLARFNDIPYDYVKDIHFGCQCKKRSGLKITEGIYCNAYLNHQFKEYFKGYAPYMGSFRILVRFWIRFQEATQVSKNSENFEKWTQQFFETTPWQNVTDLNDYKETSGLYALILDEYAKCYIGQALDIKKRILEHWRIDKFTTKGIDLFRAKDTTRIFAIPLPQKKLSQNEYKYVRAIPPKNRLNFLQGGTISFHEAQNTSPLFDKDDDYISIEQREIIVGKNANHFEEKAT